MQSGHTHSLKRHEEGRCKTKEVVLFLHVHTSQVLRHDVQVQLAAAARVRRLQASLT